MIPLSDFSEPTIAKKYGAKPDAETLDMLNTVARQKEVITLSIPYGPINQHSLAIFARIRFLVLLYRLWWFSKSFGEIPVRSYAKPSTKSP